MPKNAEANTNSCDANDKKKMQTTQSRVTQRKKNTVNSCVYVTKLQKQKNTNVMQLAQQAARLYTLTRHARTHSLTRTKQLSLAPHAQAAAPLSLERVHQGRDDARHDPVQQVQRDANLHTIKARHAQCRQVM